MTSSNVILCFNVEFEVVAGGLLLRHCMPRSLVELIDRAIMGHFTQAPVSDFTALASVQFHGLIAVKVRYCGELVLCVPVLCHYIRDRSRMSSIRIGHWSVNAARSLTFGCADVRFSIG